MGIDYFIGAMNRVMGDNPVTLFSFLVAPHHPLYYNLRIDFRQNRRRRAGVIVKNG